MTTLGQRIKSRRLELGLTQEELAKKLGYSHKSSIGKIENGNNDITQSKVVEFAHALDTNVAYLMGWDAEDTEHDKKITAMMNELTNLWDLMTDEQKQQYLSIGHVLLNKADQHKD